MDHQEEKALHKKQARSEEKRERKATEIARANVADGTRKIRPAWLGALGLGLGLLALFYWMFTL